MKKIITLIFAFVLFMGCAHVSYAQDQKEIDEKAIEELNDNVDEEMRIANEERKAAAEDTYVMISELIDGLPPRQQKHFMVAYSNYNLIETVKTVQKDVGTAVDKCGENNPDMKADLDARFKDWKADVEPSIKEARSNFDNMLLAQDYASKKEVKAIFNSVDLTREKTYDQIQKIPVTSPEACQYLLSKMDETQARMIQILQTTLVTFPKIFEGLDDTEQDSALEGASDDAKEREKVE